MTYIWPKMQFEDVDWKMLSTWQFVAQRTMTIRDLSEISRGEGGGVGLLNLGLELRWPIPTMRVKFANPPLDLGLKYHDLPILNKWQNLILTIHYGESVLWKLKIYF